MKLRLVFIILYATSVLSIDNHDQNDEPFKVTLWTFLAHKTSNDNNNLLELKMRQEVLERMMIKLVENVERNLKYLKESRLEDNVRQTQQPVDNKQPPKTLLNGSPNNISLNRNHEWTAVLRRQDGTVNFNRNWTDYKYGFGNPDGEFFIGLEKLHLLTTYVAQQELLVILEDWTNRTCYAKYNIFRIGSEAEKYALKELGSYSGDAGDSLTQHKGMKFSTADEDNDVANRKHCAANWGGAWWYRDCYSSHLTGPYRQENASKTIGVEWLALKAGNHSLKSAVMLIRSKNE